MIYIDTHPENKKKGENTIIANDIFYNLNTINEVMTEEEKELIMKIDYAILTPDGHIQTKYGVGTLRNLSTGCKTVLNILRNKEKNVCVDECGPNVLEIIFSIDGAHILMTYPQIFHIHEDVVMCFDGEIVVGADGYNNWWTEEYRRRDSSDI